MRFYFFSFFLPSYQSNVYDTDYSDNWEKKKNRNICCRKNSLLGYLIEQMRPIKGGPKPSSRPFFREGFQIQFSPFGKFRTGRAIFFRPTPKFFADRFTEVGCGGEVEVAWPFGEDGCQERCRAAGTTRTPRASTYFGSTTLGRNPAPLLP